MSDIVCTTHDLIDLRHRFRGLTNLSGSKDPVSFRQNLRRMLNYDLKVVIAEERRKIIGSFAVIGNSMKTRLGEDKALQNAVIKQGVALNRVVVWSLIYTDSTCRGRGVATTMEKIAMRLCHDMGFTHRIGIAPDSEEIFQWINRRGDFIDLGVPSPTGHPSTLTPINID